VSPQNPAPLPPKNLNPTSTIHVTLSTPQALEFRVVTETPFDPSKDPCENPSGETEKLCDILGVSANVLIFPSTYNLKLLTLLVRPN
jgi:hypothetical protein